MADGALIGNAPAIKRGRVAHTDGSETVVTGAEITLPSTEGYYVLRAFAAGGSATATNKYALGVVAGVFVNEGAANVGESVQLGTNRTGYTAAITVSGLTARLSVTAANGVYSAGFIECLEGVELAITPA